MPKLFLNADNSQISTFLECPSKWHRQYILNIEPITDKPRRGIDNGTAIHALMEAYYNYIGRKNTVNDSMAKALELFARNRNGKISDEDFTLIKSRFREYVLYYSIGGRGDFRPKVINGVPQVEFGFTVPLVNNDQYMFNIEGRIDLISDNDLFIDHKSQERTHNHYPFDTQFMTYSLATGLLNGCVNYFGMQKTANTSTFRRMSLAFSRGHIARWKEKLIIYFYQMAHCLKSGNFPENEHACSGAWGFHCPYAKIHEALNPQVKELIMLNQYQPRVKWQPWKLEETETTNANSN